MNAPRVLSCYVMRRLSLVAVALVLTALYADVSNAAWTYSEDTDDFDGTTTAVAMSSNTIGKPHRASRVVVRCTDGTALEAYLTFGYLNRSGDGPIAVKVGDTAPTQVRVGESESRTALFLHHGAFPEKVEFLNGLAATDTFAVRFVYYKEGLTTIKYDMTGSHAAIRQVLTACDATARAERMVAQVEKKAAHEASLYDLDDEDREDMAREVNAVWEAEALRGGGRARVISGEESLSMRCATGKNTLTWRSGMFPRRRGAARGVVRLAVDGDKKAYPAHLLRLATGLEVEVSMGRKHEVVSAMRAGHRVVLSIHLIDRTATATFGLNGAETAIAKCLEHGGAA